ncbi:hypothetical protein BDW22DRAFT_348171 [Trametopsis cervina]|nr:hypothetical protein BDW22DRAFT_348171 [Trametopsis cervina]
MRRARGETRGSRDQGGHSETILAELHNRRGSVHGQVTSTRREQAGTNIGQTMLIYAEITLLPLILCTLLSHSHCYTHAFSHRDTYPRTLMALSHSPRKQLATLAIGDGKPAIKSKHQPAWTKRIFFCGVVVEGSEHGRELSPDVQDLVASLGDPMDMDPVPSTSQLPSTNNSYADLSQSTSTPHGRKRATTLSSGSSTPTASISFDIQIPTGPFSRKRANTISDPTGDTINELVATERTYVGRLKCLKDDYADPLRKFSRSKETAILAPYQAKTLFANIDQILPVNEAFLADLEKMVSPDNHEFGGIGDVALKHFKFLKGFENYKQYYAKREEAQAIFEREARKTSGTGFSAFIDRIKYANAPDNRNRVGLRELLMEPVQRIPRYTLLFRQIIKQMPAHDPQRAKLIEADELASRIASAEIDEQTKRARTMYCLKASIEDFPDGLWSNSRQFIDCIDVEDHLQPGASDGPGTPSSSAGFLHCSLLLFDDKLLIVKRLNGEKSARALSGLDELDKVTTKLKAFPSGSKKAGMAYKGMVEVTDVVTTDVGGSDFHLFLENPPTEQGGLWGSRQFRALSVVLPPAPANLDPTRTDDAKSRFLQNLWEVQARYRTKNGQSVVLCAEDKEVESRGGKMTIAKTYFNVYQRTAFLQESRKTKIIMHVDPLGTADPIDFGIRGPFVVVRVQPMAGELSRYTVTSHLTGDEGEEDIVHTSTVPGRIIDTIHHYGLFTFKTGNISAPSTPSATTRTRAAIFGLDAISRNLFHARPAVHKGDIFGGSMNAHRRKTTVASRSSAYTTSTNATTNDSSLSRFTRSRSNSISTAATSAVEEDGRSIQSLDTGSRSSRRTHSLSKKLVKTRKAKSPATSGLGSDSEPEPVRSASRASSEWTDADDDDFEEEPTFEATREMDQSERDLTARLALARRNSQTQHDRQLSTALTVVPAEETIYEYEDEPPQSLRSVSRTSKHLPEIPSEYDDDESPFVQSDDETDARTSRPESRTDDRDRRPRGPRTPSPLPPTERLRGLSAVDDLEKTLISLAGTPRPRELPTTPLPRSKRQFFEGPSTAGHTPGPAQQVFGEQAKSVEPLSIKRKPSIGLGASPYRLRQYNVGRGSPLTKPAMRKTSKSSLRKTSAQLKAMRVQVGGFSNEESDRLFEKSDAVKTKLESTKGLVAKMRAVYEQSKASPAASTPEPERAASPVKGLRSPLQWVAPAAPMTREARARMEEMQRVIQRRGGEGTPRRPLSFHQDDSPGRSFERPREDPTASSMNEVAKQLENELTETLATFEHVHSGLKAAVIRNLDISKELVKDKSEAMIQKRAQECVKELLGNATAEMDAMYDAFNEELEKVFYEVQLPEDEAWDAVAADLHETKMVKQALEKENAHLKLRLAEEQNQSETYRQLLRDHGIIY